MVVSFLIRRSPGLWAAIVALLVLWAPPVRAQIVAEPARASALTGPGVPGTPAEPAIMMTRDAAGKATVHAVRISGDFALDGALTEAVYATVAPLSDFVQQEPNEGQPATEKTEAWIFFDDENIYVGAKMYESEPTRRVASEMRRDSFNMYNNDHLAVVFDTFNDRRNGFGFSANRLGGMFDWSTTNEQPSSNWNGLWQSKAQDFDGGWSVKMMRDYVARLDGLRLGDIET